MSNIISMGLLTQRREDAVKMEVRAKELLKESDPNSVFGIEIDFDEADIDSKRWFDRLWGISICDVTDHYDSATEDSSASVAFKILERVAATFPDIKMRYWMTWEGPLAQEAISVNGELVEIAPWTFVVHVPASDAYQQLLDILNTRDLLLNLWPNRCSIGWRFDKNTETQQTELLAEEVSQQMGNTELLLYCYLDGCPDLYLEEYAHARNGCIEWVHTDQERLALMEIPYLPISIENDVEAIEGDHFTMEDILIRPDVVFENCLTKARVGTPYYQDYLISLLTENEDFKRFLQPSDERWVHQRMLEQEKEADERKAEQDDLPF